jgi:YbgC/YbaW family acyl-CoA thioester hydrolase
LPAGEFSILRRVQFAETDMAGVMHFANYFRWMEEIEHAFFRSVGLSVVMQREGREIGWPRVSVSCEYLGPARFEDEVELRLRVLKVGDKSLTYEVDFQKGSEKLALGKVTSVCCAVRPDRGFEPISIPREIREKLASNRS